MNQEHYEKVKRVLAMSEEALQMLKNTMDGGKALVQCTRLSGSIWEKEFFPNRKGDVPPRGHITLDLSGADLSGGLFASLADPDLKGTDFHEACLERTRWSFIRVTKVNFDRANLRDSVFLSVCAGGASFRNADLSGASLDLLVFDHDVPPDFTNASLTGAKIILHARARFILDGANLQGCRVTTRPPEHPGQLQLLKDSLNTFLSGLSPEQRSQVSIEEPSQLKGGGVSGKQCFIATACYGSSDSPEVQVLRHFRDAVLVASPIGRLWVEVYYRISPPIAKVLRRSPCLRVMVRAGIVHPLVRIIQGGHEHRLGRTGYQGTKDGRTFKQVIARQHDQKEIDHAVS